MTVGAVSNLEPKVILNPVLPFYYFFCSLTSLGLDELAIVCPLQIKQGLAHFVRQYTTVGEPLLKTFLPCLVLKMFISLVMQSSGSFAKSTISFSYESSYELMCILLHRMARVKLTVSTTTPRRFIQVMGIASFLSKIFKT